MIGPRAQQVKPVPQIRFRFRALPSEVMASRTLSSTAKLLFAAIVDAARGNASGLCKIANATLGDRIGRSESEVGRCMLELEKAGLVSRVFGPSKNVRVGVSVTWSEAPQDCGTGQPSAPQDRVAGSASTGERVPQPSAPSRAPGPEPSIQTGSIAPSSGEEKPSPGQVAAAMRAMIAGKYAPALFDAEAKGPAESRSLPAKAIGSTDTFAARTMFGRVGYSARAAAFRPTAPKRSAADQIAELRTRSAARERDGQGSA